MNNQRVGLAVARIQPLHNGHCRIIDRMIRNHKTVILCIGSSQKNREKHNPYTFEERKQMVKNIYGDRIKIVQLNDLGTTEGSTDWVDYVLNKIKKLGLPNPTDFYTGSLADGRWYSKRFGNKEEILADFQPHKWVDYLADNGFPRFLHIIDRSSKNIPSGTEVRTFLELRTTDWYEWVPTVNHKIVEDNFPNEFRIGKA